MASATRRKPDCDDRDSVVEFLIHCAAMLKTGQLSGVSVSIIPIGGGVMGKHYLTPGAEKLVLIADQMRMLDK